MLGSSTSAFSQSFFIASTKTESNAGYNLPLSAMAGSTTNSAPSFKRSFAMASTLSICSVLPRYPVYRLSKKIPSFAQWAAIPSMSSVKSRKVNPEKPAVWVERMAEGKMMVSIPHADKMGSATVKEHCPTQEMSWMVNTFLYMMISFLLIILWHAWRLKTKGICEANVLCSRVRMQWQLTLRNVFQSSSCNSVYIDASDLQGVSGPPLR